MELFRAFLVGIGLGALVMAAAAALVASTIAATGLIAPWLGYVYWWHVPAAIWAPVLLATAVVEAAVIAASVAIATSLWDHRQIVLDMLRRLR